MSDSLVPMVLMLGISTVVASSMILLSALLGRPKQSVVDRSPYECGSKPFDTAEAHRFSMHFYLVAMLFILFDIEVAFLYPWAVTFKSLAANRMFVLGEMAVFLGILVVGFVYLWKRGALEWE